MSAQVDVDRVIAALEKSTREAAKIEVKEALVEFVPVLARLVKAQYEEERVRRSKCPCCGRRYRRPRR
jgi:hypothetical protein